LLNMLILLVIVAIFSVFLFDLFFGEPASPEEKCVDVNNDPSFVYDACYDAYSKNIFLKLKRAQDPYEINQLKVSFFDEAGQSYKLDDVPDRSDVGAYKIPALKNPQNIDVVLTVKKDFSKPVCENSRRLFVTYCPTGIHGDDFDVTISPLPGVGVEDFIDIVRLIDQTSDIFSLDIVDRERIWKSQCASNWDCSNWEECVDGVQRRSCEDKKDCFIPTDVPDSVRYCDGACVEDWQCEWSECNGGYVTPTCVDLNKCGTSFKIPKKLECDVSKDCVQDVQCGDWTICNVDYTFDDLDSLDQIQELTGVKSRICVDENSCVPGKEESKTCSVSIDIYTDRFVKCGVGFIGVYNKLDGKLIARINEGSEDNPSLNIRLDDEDNSLYCDECFDGLMNGAEEGVDCGGSCISCEEKYKDTEFVGKSWWTRFNDWLNGFFLSGSLLN